MYPFVSVEIQNHPQGWMTIFANVAHIVRLEPDALDSDLWVVVFSDGREYTITEEQQALLLEALDALAITR